MRQAWAEGSQGRPSAPHRGKIKAFPEEPAGQPDAAPVASSVCAETRVGALPSSGQLACAQQACTKTRLLPGDFVVRKRLSGGLQRFC